jgi:hypothetical protein
MIAAPGLIIGFGAGAVASLLAVAVGQPALIGLALAVPLGLLGAVYSILEARGHVRRGGFAPACLYWLVGFPLARLVQELVTHLSWPPGVLGFLAYQAVLSAGFAIGFLWLHERIRAGQRVAVHTRDGDPSR